MTEGNSEKGIADIKAILAKTNGNCVINVDPNDSPDARPIVEACKAAGATVVTQWNKPNDLHPWDFDPNYIAHISFSGVPHGKAMAETLIKSMGGKGGIVALGGIESNVPAIERKKGLDEALKANPDVKLLDYQVANWSATEALEKTNAWLTQFGDKITGIWAANDDMGLAAVEALRAAGKAGKVPVTGIDGIQLAVEAILKKEMAGTVAWDPYWQGGMGLSIGYHAKTGTFDPSKEPKDHREFYGKGVTITAENAQSFYDSNVKTEPEARLERYLGPLQRSDPVRLRSFGRPGARDAGPGIRAMLRTRACSQAENSPGSAERSVCFHRTGMRLRPKIGSPRHRSVDIFGADEVRLQWRRRLIPM